MDPFLIALTFFFAAVAAKEAFWGGIDDPGWELRWRSLDPGYRGWLAAMSTSRSWMKTLDDPEEIGLARGFSRREGRRVAYVDLVVVALAGFALALVLVGTLPSAAVTSILVFYPVIRIIAEGIRHWLIRRKLADRGEPDTAPSRLGASPGDSGPVSGPVFQ